MISLLYFYRMFYGEGFVFWNSGIDLISTQCQMKPRQVVFLFVVITNRMRTYGTIDCQISILSSFNKEEHFL